MVDELLDNYLANMDPEEVEALVSQMLLEQEAPPAPRGQQMRPAARAAMRQRQLADAFGYYYPEETQ